MDKKTEQITKKKKKKGNPAWGKGFFVAKPNTDIEKCHYELQERIRASLNRNFYK